MFSVLGFFPKIIVVGPGLVVTMINSMKSNLCFFSQMFCSVMVRQPMKVDRQDPYALCLFKSQWGMKEDYSTSLTPHCFWNPSAHRVCLSRKTFKFTSRWSQSRQRPCENVYALQMINVMHVWFSFKINMGFAALLTYQRRASNRIGVRQVSLEKYKTLKHCPFGSKQSSKSVWPWASNRNGISHTLSLFMYISLKVHPHPFG